jgi:hypothetical protein
LQKLTFEAWCQETTQNKSKLDKPNTFFGMSLKEMHPSPDGFWKLKSE